MGSICRDQAEPTCWMCEKRHPLTRIELLGADNSVRAPPKHQDLASSGMYLRMSEEGQTINQQSSVGNVLAQVWSVAAPTWSFLLLRVCCCSQACPGRRVCFCWTRVFFLYFLHHAAMLAWCYVCMSSVELVKGEARETLVSWTTPMQKNISFFSLSANFLHMNP